MGVSRWTYKHVLIALLAGLVVADFAADVWYQANFYGFDGPLAWGMQYASGFNRVAVIVAVAVLLLGEYHFGARTRRWVHLASGVAFLSFGCGLIYVLRDAVHLLGIFQPFEIWRVVGVSIIVQAALVGVAADLFLRTRATGSTPKQGLTT